MCGEAQGTRFFEDPYALKTCRPEDAALGLESRMRVDPSVLHARIAAGADELVAVREAERFGEGARRGRRGAARAGPVHHVRGDERTASATRAAAASGLTAVALCFAHNVPRRRWGSQLMLDDSETERINSFRCFSFVCSGRLETPSRNQIVFRITKPRHDAESTLTEKFTSHYPTATRADRPVHFASYSTRDTACQPFFPSPPGPTSITGPQT